MNVVDSSGWLEFFANSPNAGNFSKPIQQTDQLLVPPVTLTEVFKRVLQQRGEQSALEAVAHMMQGRVAGLSPEIAVEAARLGHALKIPLVDSVILATARQFNAILWTQDEDFKDVPDVQYFPKR